MSPPEQRKVGFEPAKDLVPQPRWKPRPTLYQLYGKLGVGLAYQMAGLITGGLGELFEEPCKDASELEPDPVRLGVAGAILIDILKKDLMERNARVPQCAVGAIQIITDPDYAQKHVLIKDFMKKRARRMNTYKRYCSHLKMLLGVKKGDYICQGGVVRLSKQDQEKCSWRVPLMAKYANAARVNQ